MSGGAAANGHAAAGPTAAAAAAAGEAEGEPPAVEVAGADFDWADRSWARAPARDASGSPEAAAATAAAAAAAAGDVPQTAPDIAAAEAAAASQGGQEGFQLRNLAFSVPRGQLVGIVGPVGSGKSSILAALLGELQPIRQPAPAGTAPGAAAADGPGVPGPAAASAPAAAAPIAVRGSVAYCSQVPWIVGGTLKVRAVQWLYSLHVGGTATVRCGWVGTGGCLAGLPPSPQPT